MIHETRRTLGHAAESSISPSPLVKSARRCSENSERSSARPRIETVGDAKARFRSSRTSASRPRALLSKPKSSGAAFTSAAVLSWKVASPWCVVPMSISGLRASPIYVCPTGSSSCPDRFVHLAHAYTMAHGYDSRLGLSHLCGLGGALTCLADRLGPYKRAFWLTCDGRRRAFCRAWSGSDGRTGAERKRGGVSVPHQASPCPPLPVLAPLPAPVAGPSTRCA